MPGVLAAQPMGFWSPQSLVADARRHGVRVLPADINRSLSQATVEQKGKHQVAEPPEQWRTLTPHPAALTSLDVHEDLAVRLGLAPIKGLGGAGCAGHRRRAPCPWPLPGPGRPCSTREPEPFQS